MLIHMSIVMFLNIVPISFSMVDSSVPEGRLTDVSVPPSELMPGMRLCKLLSWESFMPSATSFAMSTVPLR